MNPTMTDESEVRRLAEASAWRVNLSAARQHTSADFEQWLADDPKNEAAWDRVQEGWTLFGDHASTPAVLALRRGALGRAERAGKGQWLRDGWLPRLAACLILFACIGGLSFAFWPTQEPLTYATTMGERRVVTLEDGSRISLDSSSEVRIDYSDDARRLELVAGQARFDVAHDALRPFSVRARDRIVVATGTSFNVDLIGSKVQVTLIEGKVIVLDQDEARGSDAGRKSGNSAIPLAAGQQLVAAAPSAPAEIRTANLEQATSWESGELIFDDEPLGAIAERMNRYSNQAVRVDPAVAGRRLSGMFKAGDVPAFITTVSEYLQVEAKAQADGSVLLRPGA